MNAYALPLFIKTSIMRRIILFLIASFSCSLVFGQAGQTSVRYPVKGKQISLQVDEATIAVEGYSGDELVIEPDANYPAFNPQVPGFNLLTSGVAAGDNFVHVSDVKEDAGSLYVHLRSIYNAGLNYRHWHILVPKNAHLKITFYISQTGAKMSFKNLSNELEIEGTAPVMEFSDITGPLTLSEGPTGHQIGGTEKIIIHNLQMSQKDDNNEDAPFLNIITSYGDVDISLPAAATATIQVDVLNGNLYSNLNMVQQRPAYPMVKGRYTGNLNGGGKMIAINAAYGNVYLRKDR
jgi:hypothetical protein